MPSNHLICHLLCLLPSTFLSIRVFSNELTLHVTWPKNWSFSLSISPSNEYSGLISLRVDWFDLAVQGTLKSLLQHHSSKASILRCSAFFIVQLSHPYMTTGMNPYSFFRSLKEASLSSFTLDIHFLVLSWYYFSSLHFMWFSSVTQSCLTLCDLQHARLPCPSPNPTACSNSCPSSQWCHPTITSSVVPFSSHPQSFPASGSFPMRQFFASGDQSIGVSASTSLPIW